MALTQNQIQSNINAMVSQGASKEEVISYIDSLESKPSGLTDTQQDIVDFYREKDKGVISKGIRALTGIRPKSERLEELFISKTPIRTNIKQRLEEAAGVLPYMIPVGAIKGATSAQKAASLLKSAGKAGSIIAASDFSQKISQGEEEDQAAKEALYTGLGATVLGVGLPLTGKAVKKAGKGLFKAISRAESNAIEAAIKDPSIITSKQKEIVDIAPNITKSIGNFAKNEGKKYSERLSKIKATKGNIIDTSSTIENLVKKDVDLDVLRRSLKRVSRSESIKIEDNVLDRFISGGNLNFDEARKVNSLLADLQGTRIEGIGSGIKGKIGSAKTKFLNEINEKVPGTKKINKAYALAIKEEQRLKRLLGVDRLGDLKESTLKRIGEQILDSETKGGKFSKTSQARALKRLDRRQGTDFYTQLKNAVAEDKLINVADKSILSDIRTGAGIAGGAILGGPIGAIAGAAGAQAITGPQATKLGILSARPIGAAIEGASIMATPIVTRSLNSIVYGEE